MSRALVMAVYYSSGAFPFELASSSPYKDKGGYVDVARWINAVSRGGLCSLFA